jgi:hypothetical protein
MPSSLVRIFPTARNLPLLIACAAPFANVDLSTISSDTIDALNTMREAAESAETDEFNPQIAAASGADQTALQNGKIKNKVLKLAGEVQVINIKARVCVVCAVAPC